MCIQYSLITKIDRILTDTRSPPYVRDQILYAINRKDIIDFEKITTIPKSLRILLKKRVGEILHSKVKNEKFDKQAHKVIFKTKRGNRFEAVNLAFNSFNSLCISSQSGCGMGCKFCATGSLGLQENLSTDQILDQVLYFKSCREKVHNVSFMGMGEPLANQENVFQAIRILTNPEYFNIGQRRISISTIGILSGIEKLTREFPQVNITLSLHTPFRRQREDLMPVAKKYSISKVINVLNKHIRITSRRVLIAYLLLRDINDSEKHAEKLVSLIKQNYLYHIVLIEYNKTNSSTFKRSTKESIKKFCRILDKKNISYSFRKSFGREINAACGQFMGK